MVDNAGNLGLLVVGHLIQFFLFGQSDLGDVGGSGGVVNVDEDWGDGLREIVGSGIAAISHTIRNIRVIVGVQLSIEIRIFVNVGQAGEVNVRTSRSFTQICVSVGKRCPLSY